MPSDLTIRALTPAVPVGETEAATKVTTEGATPFAAVPSSQGLDAPSKPSFPNPSLHLDPQLGLVVIEFRNAAGGVTNSIPTSRQLQAYRDSEARGASHDADRDVATGRRAGAVAAGDHPGAHATGREDR